MKIGELAKRTGPTTYTIRYYERIGLLPRPARRPHPKGCSKNDLKPRREQVAMLAVCTSNQARKKRYQA